MNWHKRVNRQWLLTGAGLLSAALIGFAAAHYTDRGPPPASGVESHEVAAEAHSEEGESHEKGRAEAGGFVRISSRDAAAAGVSTVSVSRGGGGEFALSGQAAAAPDARAAVAAAIGGSIERVMVAPGSRVARGSPLVVIRSAEGAVVRADADAARADAAAAAAAFAREDRLLRAGVVARQDWEAARATSLKAHAAARAAQARIGASGSPGVLGIATIRSPINGVVTALQVSPGGFIAQGGVVAEVSDPRRVELVFNLPAAAAQRIQPGMQLRTRLPDGSEGGAVVTAVAPAAPGSSVAAVVRARPIGPLPVLGAPVSARAISDVSGAITVPDEAVQTLDGRSVVFVQEPNGFRARPVVAGRSANGSTEILSGLRGDERVVGRGAFLLKAELTKASGEEEEE